ncbi:hypothetical protein BAOM_3103 [Peribacillus asahii]|uniref:Calcineurin-like phosphoesterase domain-containing protein n=1 Tax=Peribacillus asahii TaxID=228899 RepID=A0A3T0KTC9_9BACI|nr:hypothetical protein [Peribacillus asahii]AZV43712.1 hypothetical protein BAOM_3103 [Peribacillus asahii]
MNPILTRQDNESFIDYHIRLFENKNEYGIDNYEIASLLNVEYGSNYDESKWRKDYSQFVKWKDYLIKKDLDSEKLQKYEEIRIESEKEKIRNQDQKREYKKLIRNQARFEHLKDEILAAVLNLEKKKPLEFKSPILVSDTHKEGLALFSDWHFGLRVDNTFNKFNKEIFDIRVEHLVNKIIEHGKKNNISTLHVANLGDMITGTIHVALRADSHEDSIGQIKYVSETLSEVLAKLANTFPNIIYYNVIGNHGRNGHKNDVGIKENFEYLIPWFIEARLKDFNNIKIITDKDGYIPAKIMNEEVVFVHGNFDKIEQSVKNLPQVLGYVPTLIFGGHVHHHYEKEHGRTLVSVNGSLIGADDHTVQGRYGGIPSQKFMVLNEDGIESTYRFKLNKIV